MKWKKLNKFRRFETTTVSVWLPIYLLFLLCDSPSECACVCVRERVCGARCHIDWMTEAAHSGFVVLNLHLGSRK